MENPYGKCEHCKVPLSLGNAIVMMDYYGEQKAVHDVCFKAYALEMLEGIEITINKEYY